ncbi:MAG: hypothetical protein ACP5N1_02810 [Candidatus Woesearchaeota archaeon]
MKKSQEKGKEKEIITNIMKELNITYNENDKISAKIIEENNFVFEKIGKLVEKHVQEHINDFDLNKPTIEGESKKIHQLGNIALVELKPTMYSFTYNRYGIVEGSELVRLDFWKLFASEINNTSVNAFLGLKNNFTDEISEFIKIGILTEKYPFISNYLGETTINNKRYAMIRFAKSIPPLEIVWKKYLVGTMKHNLKKVDSYKTKTGTNILYEEKFPKEFVRFDWRNPLPDKDECIPDDFAEFYINTNAAKKVSTLVSQIINNLLQKKGYELADICYFMNEDGNMIYSEITPDGMRIKKKEESYDKDLWRSGKEKKTVVETWKKLYYDLLEIK